VPAASVVKTRAQLRPEAKQDRTSNVVQKNLSGNTHAGQETKLRPGTDVTFNSAWFVGEPARSRPEGGELKTIGANWVVVNINKKGRQFRSGSPT